MQWIYLSPHFDDAVLSCGGLIWEQARLPISPKVWTICAGPPPEGRLSPFAEALHARWQQGPPVSGRSATEVRRAEDQAANNRLGAASDYFSIPDCIYRQGPDGSYLYASEEALFWEIHPDEQALVAGLARQFDRAAGPGAFNVVAPLARGGHVDHRLVLAAASAWQKRRSDLRLWFYADYPYVLREPELVKELQDAGYQMAVFPVSRAGVQAWMDAVAAHASQISTFWLDRAAMETAIKDYWQEMAGVRLWANPQIHL